MGQYGSDKARSADFHIGPVTKCGLASGPVSALIRKSAHFRDKNTMPFDPTNDAQNGAANNPVATNTPDATQPTQPSALGAPVQPAAQQTPPAANPANNATVSNAPANDPNSNHPAVQRAGLLRTIAETLAGGPRFQAVPNSDGTVTRTRVPLSKADIGLAIAMEALSGGIAGLSQRGPSAVGMAAQAGYQQVSQQQQKAQQEQEAQAQTDATNKANAIARAAAIHSQNAQLMLVTQQAERLGIQSLKDATETNAALLQSYKDAGAVSDEGVTQDALLDGMKSGKYNGLSMTALPDGWTIVPGKGPEQTFAIVNKPAEKVTLTQDQVDEYAANHVRGFPRGMRIPANGFPVSGYILGTANQQMLANRFMLQEASDVATTLAKSNDPADKELAKSIPDFGKLMDDDRTGLALQNALPRLQKYLHHDGSGDTFYQALQAMSQPTRPSPTNPKQTIDNSSDAKAAQVIAGSFGDGDPATGWKILRVYHDAITPQPFKSESDAESVLSDPASTPREKAHAKSYLALTAQQKAATAGAEARAKKSVEAGTGAGNAAQFASEPPVNGVRPNYLNNLPPTQAELVRSIGEGRTEISSRTAGTKEGKTLMEEVTTAYPGYDFSRAPEYAATRKAFTSGKTADAINALNTAMGHMLVMYQNATLGGSLPIIGGVERAAGNQSAIDLANSKTALVDELGKAYKAGALTDQDVKSWKGRIDAWSPSEIQGNARSFVQLLDSKLGSYEQQWKNGSPPGAVAPIAILSPEARNAYQMITGRQPITGNAQSQSRGSIPPQGATMKVPGSDGKLHWSDGKRDLGVVQ